MELTGRTYIFSAATLIFLAATLKLYDNFAATPQGQETVRGWRLAICDAVGVDAGNLRLGCHAWQIAPLETQAQTIMRGGAKTIKLSK